MNMSFRMSGMNDEDCTVSMSNVDGLDISSGHGFCEEPVITKLWPVVWCAVV